MELAQIYLTRYRQANDIDRIDIILAYRTLLDTFSTEERQAASAYMAAHLPTLSKLNTAELDDAIDKAEALLNRTMTTV